MGAEGGKEKPDRGAEVADTPEGAITDIGQILARVPIGIGSFRSRPPALSRGLAVQIPFPGEGRKQVPTGGGKGWRFGGIQGARRGQD